MQNRSAAFAFVAAGVLMVVASNHAYAQSHGHGHGAHPPAAAKPSEPAHAKPYRDASEKMHGPMMEAAAIADPDEAFVRGMIPHHQGAVEMARIALRTARDEKIKTWAANIIRDQEREIAEMEAWLKANAKK